MTSELIPERLKRIHQPPKQLFVMGNPAVLHAPMIAVVGTRHPTMFAKSLLRAFIPTLVQAGFVIVSGLARGIDTLAHEAALACGGKTVAVLGSGLGHLYPRENRGLAKAIAASGAVITEYAEDVGPTRWHFPERNRMIAGLARGVWVVEAPEKSGALITAEFAMEEGRDVFATPGPALEPKYAGCHRLIQDGAKLVMTPQDILDELIPEGGSIRAGRATHVIPPSLSPDLTALLEKLSSHQPIHIDRLAEVSALPMGQLSPLLGELCLQGLIDEMPGHHYVRV